MSILSKTVFAACILLSIAITLFILLSIWSMSEARAHDAPSGMSYEGGCCGGNDCRPAYDGELVELKNGDWLVTPTNEIITASDPKVHYSTDGQLHRCSELGGNRRAKTLCIYVHPSGT